MSNKLHSLPKKYFLPGSESFLNRLFDMEFGPISAGFDIVLYALKLSGKSGLNRMFVEDEKKSQFKKRFPKHAFILINETSLRDEGALWLSLAKSLGLEPDPLGKTFSVKAIADRIEYLTRKQGKTVVIILDQFDKWPILTEEIMVSLGSLKRIFKEHVYFVVLLDSACEYDNDTKKFYSFLNVQKVYWPLYPIEELENQLNRDRLLKNLPTREFTDQELLQLQKLSLGLCPIFHRISYMDIDYDNPDINKLLEDSEISKLLGIIFSEMPITQIKAISDQSFDQELFESGVMGQDGKVPSQLFINYASRLIESSDNKLDLSDPLAKNLTRQEGEVFSLLLENQNKVVTRESIAKKMWGENYTFKYSDWSIDSVISRLRKKVGEKYEIETYKGRGFGMKVV